MERILDKMAVHKFLPNRKPETHKYNYGRLLLLCGSTGYTGAPALAALGALRAGAGMVFLGVPRSIYEIEAIKLTEPVVFPLPDERGAFSEEAIDEILPYLEKSDCVLIGPGMGKTDGTFAVVSAVLKKSKSPVILDADGINLLSGHKDLLRGRTGATILTPHAGEFCRLVGTDLPVNRESAELLAKELGVIVLLKGHRSVITDGRTTYLNQTGNPGMAVGGSGDVLAGMIAALVGQGLTPLDAAACAAWLHGRAGDICQKKIGQYGMLPSDLLQVLPRLLK